MAHFYNISAYEMASFLEPRGFKPISLPNTNEIVYGKRVDKGKFPLSLRIYTGIVSSQSRGVGDDAIRVNLFMRHNDRIVKVASSKRVHRVTNWKTNLQDRIDFFLAYSPDFCNKCGLPLVPRKGKFGEFLSCVGYPDCNYTKN